MFYHIIFTRIAGRSANNPELTECLTILYGFRTKPLTSSCYLHTILFHTPSCTLCLSGWLTDCCLGVRRLSIVGVIDTNEMTISGALGRRNVLHSVWSLGVLSIMPHWKVSTPPHTHPPTHTHSGQVLCLSCLHELFNALSAVCMSARCPIEQPKSHILSGIKSHAAFTARVHSCVLLYGHTL